MRRLLRSLGLAALCVLASPLALADGITGGSSGSTTAVAPTQASTGLTSWLNQETSSTITDATNGVQLFYNGNGANLFSAREGAAPATPYSIAIQLVVTGPWASSMQPCFGWTDGTKIEVAMNNIITGIFEYGYTTTTSGSFTQNATAYATVFNFNPIWLKIRDDGTTHYAYYSMDGTFWVLLYSHANTGGYLANYNHIIFCTAGSQVHAATITSWTPGTN